MGDDLRALFQPGFPREEPELLPRAGEGASDPKFNRLAAEEFKRAADWKDIDTALHGSRGTGFRITQVGERLAGQAKDAADLQRLIRQQFASHLLQSDSDAQKLAEAAFKAFAKRQKSDDTDYAWMMGQAIAKEFRDMVADNRRADVAQRAKAMEKDPIFQQQQIWREKVEALSKETGLDYQFVEAFLIEHSQASAPRHPGIIDPRGVKMFQLRAPMQGAAVAINFLTAGTAGSFASFVTGEGLNGEKLSTGERLLEGLLTVLSFAGGGGGNVVREAVQIGRLGLTSLKLVLTAGRNLGRLAAAAGTDAFAFLRMIGRLRNIDPSKVIDLLRRMREARAGGKMLRLTDGEATLMRQMDDAFRETSLPTARVVKMAAPTARAFMFLNRKQPMVLGRLLGRPWTAPTASVARAAVQEAENIAAGIASRVAAHWQAALPRGKTSPLGVCEDVYDDLKDAISLKPKLNPNEFVREKLFNAWRVRAMKRIGADKALVSDLQNEAGIIVGRNHLTRNWTIHIRTKGPNAARVQTHVDFDHAVVGHQTAVSRAIQGEDSKQLISTIDAGNLQFMTARENRNFIEAVRAAAKEAEQAP